MEVKIGKSARQCTACERTFVHEEEIMSLVRVESQALLREDFCPACWADSRAKGAYSVWSSKFYDPRVAEQAPAEVFSPLRQVFYESVESEERKDMAVAFLAAQLLRRQKVFRLIKESEENENNERLVLYSDRIGTRLIEVRDPSLTYAELEAGRNRLMERLTELENPAPAEEAPEHADAQQT